MTTARNLLAAALILAGAVAPAVAAADNIPSVVVESVQFRQRYPWNGLVDIDVDIACSDAATNLALYVAAWDNAADKALTVKTLWLDGDETKNPDVTVKSGKSRIVWDARADNPRAISSDVTVSVQAYVRDMRYLVIDLSSGPDSDSYPHSFMAEPPEGGWTDEYKTDKLVMRLIPAGTFWMGSPTSEAGRYSSDELRHKVILTQPFYIGVFETTQRQYELVNGDRPSYFKNDDWYTTRPVEYVRWNTLRGDYQAYNWPSHDLVDPNSPIGKLRARTGFSKMDLPTEAQWEYACRAGTTTAMNNGTDIVSTAVNWDANMNKLANYNSRLGYTTAVGSYLPNAWGLYDMHGNVYEWCLDRYDSNNKQYEYAVDINPKDGRGLGNSRRHRGGGYQSVARYCRSAYRNDSYSDFAGIDVGFRLCCSADLQ